MSVLPVVSGANVQLTCSSGHANTVALAAITRPSGSGGFGLVSATCPTCGETSGHPISGGADQPNVQAVFLALAASGGCPCGALAPGKAAPLVRAHLRQHAQQLGAGFVA